jgi:hypothetical protein
MTEQERDSVDEDDKFAGTHGKGTGVAEAEDGSGWADLKEVGKNHEKK